MGLHDGKKITIYIFFYSGEPKQDWKKVIFWQKQKSHEKRGNGLDLFWTGGILIARDSILKADIY